MRISLHRQASATHPSIARATTVTRLRMQPKWRLTSRFSPCFPSRMLQRHTPATNALPAGPAVLVLVLITSPTGAGRAGV